MSLIESRKGTTGYSIDVTDPIKIDPRASRLLARQTITDPIGWATAYRRTENFEQPTQRDLIRTFSAEVRDLRQEIKDLKDTIASLQELLHSAIQYSDSDDSDSAVHEPEDEIDYDKARDAVKQLFAAHPNEPMYPDDVAGKIGISIGLAIAICDELEASGDIK